MEFLDKLCSEDDKSADICAMQEYHGLHRLSCLYPNLKTKKHKIFNVLLFFIYNVILLYHLVALIITAIYLLDNLSLLFQVVHLILVTSIAITVLYEINIFRPIVARLHTAFYEGLHVYDEFAEKYRVRLKIQGKKKKKYLYGCIVTIALFISLVIILIAPFLDKSMESPKQSNNTNGIVYNLPVPEWTPFSTDSWSTYIIALLIQMTGVDIELLVIYCADIMLFIFTQFLNTEVEVLINALDRLQERTMLVLHNRSGPMDFKLMKSDTELSNTYKQCLKENAIHHQKIIKLCEDANVVASIPAFVSYMFGTFTLAFGGVLLFGDDQLGLKLSAVSLIMGEMFNVFFLAWCGEQVRTANDKLNLALYSTDWNYLDKSGYLMVQIMMARAQRPLSLEGGYFFPLNYETFTYVVNTAYSYLNILFAFKEPSN